MALSKRQIDAMKSTKRTKPSPADFPESIDFEARPCLNACSNNGYCYGGVCICRPDHEGVDCSVPRDAEPGKVAACAVGCSSKCVDSAHDGGVHQYDDCSKKCFRECVDNLTFDIGATDGTSAQENTMAAAHPGVPDTRKTNSQFSDQEQPYISEESFLQQFEHSHLDRSRRTHLRHRKKQTTPQSFWDW